MTEPKTLRTSWSQADYQHPAAGWGAARSVAAFLATEKAVAKGPAAMLRMNHATAGSGTSGP